MRRKRNRSFTRPKNNQLNHIMHLLQGFMDDEKRTVRFYRATMEYNGYYCVNQYILKKDGTIQRRYSKKLKTRSFDKACQHAHKLAGKNNGIVLEYYVRKIEMLSLAYQEKAVKSLIQAICSASAEPSC
ncbi:MAG: hypothetical protein QW570_06890 [Candidatus Caldarchaeum sp.]